MMTVRSRRWLICVLPHILLPARGIRDWLLWAGCVTAQEGAFIISPGQPFCF